MSGFMTYLPLQKEFDQTTYVCIASEMLVGPPASLPVTQNCSHV